jgi:diguanylate cyclase (GGDEF)-like protein
MAPNTRQGELQKFESTGVSAISFDDELRLVEQNGIAIGAFGSIPLGTPAWKWPFRFAVPPKKNPLVRAIDGKSWGPAEIRAEFKGGIQKWLISVSAGRNGIHSLVVLDRERLNAAFVSQFGAALREHHLKVRAERDPLCGCLNKMALMEFAEGIGSQSEREGKSYAVAMIDLDRFKEVNDTYGHETGDAVLAEAAYAIKSSIRRSDVLFRYGGEEFVAVFPHTTKVRAERLAERIRNRVARHQFPSGHVTVSIGVATSDHTGPSLRNLLSRADEALYRAK